MGDAMYGHDHYHDVREIQGAAADGHRHPARDVGAADENAFTMLARSVQDLENTVTALQRKNGQEIAEMRREQGAQDDALTEVQQTVAALITRCNELQEVVTTLSRNLSSTVEALETALLQRRL